MAAPSPYIDQRYYAWKSACDTAGFQKFRRFLDWLDFARRNKKSLTDQAAYRAWKQAYSPPGKMGDVWRQWKGNYYGTDYAHWKKYDGWRRKKYGGKKTVTAESSKFDSSTMSSSSLSDSSSSSSESSSETSYSSSSAATSTTSTAVAPCARAKKHYHGRPHIGSGAAANLYSFKDDTKYIGWKKSAQLVEYAQYRRYRDWTIHCKQTNKTVVDWESYSIWEVTYRAANYPEDFRQWKQSLTWDDYCTWQEYIYWKKQREIHASAKKVGWDPVDCETYEKVGTKNGHLLLKKGGKKYIAKPEPLFRILPLDETSTYD